MLDASIYGRFQPKSALGYAGEFEQLAGMRDQRKANALARAFQQQQMEAAQAGQQRMGALRQLQQSLSGRPEAEMIEAIRAGGFPEEAAKMDRDYLERRKLRGEVEELNIKNVGDTMTQFASLLPNVRTTDHGRQWIEAQYNHPILGQIMPQVMGPLASALERIPQDPAGFEQWRRENAIGIERELEFLAEQARDAEAVRANKAREGLTSRGQDVQAATTRRGQDVQAATTRRGQDMQDRRAAEAARPQDGGGESQMQLVRKFGKAPAGFRWLPDGSMEAIPGGPADRKNTEAGIREARSRDAAVAQADRVIGKVEEALEKTGLLTAGPAARLLNLPGTPARDLQATLDTIKANLGFAELQAMRDASPTGGALGAIAVQELLALQSTVASLEQTQSPEQLRTSLAQIRNHYTRWKDAVMRARAEGDDVAEQSAGGQPTRINSDAEYEALPSGATFVAPDGTVRRKP